MKIFDELSMMMYVITHFTVSKINYEKPTLNLVQHRLIFLLLIYLRFLKSNFTQKTILLL